MLHCSSLEQILAAELAILGLIEYESGFGVGTLPNLSNHSWPMPRFFLSIISRFSFWYSSDLTNKSNLMQEITLLLTQHQFDRQYGENNSK